MSFKKESYEVVIVGAGPAGLKAAETLAKNGKKVLVLEKNKIVGKKTCGGGLSRKFLDIDFPLNKVGDKFFKSVNYYYKGRKHQILSKTPLIVITEREKLGEFMMDLAKKSGAEIRLGVPVKKIKAKFVLTEDKKIFFDYLIGADGSNSLVRNFLNIPSKRFLFALGYNVLRKYEELEIFFDSAILKDGYGAIFPHKDYTQIGITVDSRFYTMRESKKILDKWLSKMKFDIQNGKFMAGIINYDYRGFKFGNKFLVGDAAGFTSGLMGEGIFQAIISGEEVAKKIINPKYNCLKIKSLLRAKFLQEKTFKKILGIENRCFVNLIDYCFSISKKQRIYKILYKIFS